MARFILVFIIGLVIVGAVDFSAKADEIKEEADNQEIIENKICPVSGEEIDTSSGMKPAQLEYEGKIYNFCCPGCIGMFKKDPKKYIEEIEKQQKEEAEEQKQTEELESEENHSHEHHHHH